MILNFKLNNYRSYKGDVEFSMLADAPRAKNENYFEVPHYKESKKSFRILKSAVIYGANASGKSNVIKGLNGLIDYILKKPTVTQNIPIYEPFSFAAETTNKESKFELTFIGPSDCKYKYSITVSRRIVLSERLEYYPEGKKIVVLNRQNEVDENINTPNIRPDEKLMIEDISFEGKTYKIFKNQLFLSSFTTEVHPIMTFVYLYFDNNFQEVDGHLNTQKEVSKVLIKNDTLKKQLSHLLRTADTKINGFHVVDINETIERLKQKSKLLTVENMIDSYLEFTFHDFYENDVIQSSRHLFSLDDESQGSKTLYTLGTKILSALENGKTLIYDELDTSLHSYVTKMLVMLFLSPKINKKNAQLIFTTHDIALLDKDLLRKDQIWFAEKDDKGISDFYSLQDFDNLREDLPFDKWYMAGKFGGLPNIGEIESIFE